ncbi:hypothetical protein MA16_Dca023514 [Dendrobium catenatum]|uniref:Uncharacterized protein n=1 Tax=Dendrobium catenatum TaxID=906689 RepID=A0A2I0XHC4_9ASPA|nr:hypothetical protein MA16_Dca023514 [Dendrobium catenatum]
MVVLRNSDGGPARLKRWSDEAPAVVRRGSCGGPTRFQRWSRRSFFLLLLLLFSSCFAPPFVKNEGSIYRFSGVA